MSDRDVKKHLRLIKEPFRNSDNLYDFDLVDFRQFEHTPDRMPFATRAEIRTGCPFCEKSLTERVFFGKVIPYECYHCTNKLIRMQAAQISDQDYQILKGCCGIFVDGFSQQLRDRR